MRACRRKEGEREGRGKGRYTGAGEEEEDEKGVCVLREILSCALFDGGGGIELMDE